MGRVLFLRTCRARVVPAIPLPTMIRGGESFIFLKLVFFVRDGLYSYLLYPKFYQHVYPTLPLVFGGLHPFAYSLCPQISKRRLRLVFRKPLCDYLFHFLCPVLPGYFHPLLFDCGLINDQPIVDSSY